MAMLDPRMFDPATFSPFMPQMPNFGLLNIPQSAGFPAVPGAEDLSAKTAQQPGAPLSLAPPNPTPVQESPGFFGSLSNGLANNSNTLLAIGAGLLSDGYSGGLKGAMVGGKLDRDQKNQNLTEQALTARGLTPEMARIVAGNPALLQGVLSQSLGLKAQTDDIKEYEYAKQQGFKGGLSDWMAHKRAGAGEFGLQPIWGTGPDGKPTIVQLGKSGTAIQSKLPEGVQVGKDVIKIDAGTHTILLDPVTRQPIAQVPKNIEGKEAAEEVGKGMGKAQVDLPRITDNATFMLKAIDDVTNDPYREIGTGMSAISTYFPGTGAYDFGQKVEQLKGKTFLEAFNSLRGGGQITEAEGKKATDAIARLSTFQTEEGFKAALKDLREVVVVGLERARKMAGQQQTRPGPAPQAGGSDLKAKYGLD